MKTTLPIRPVLTSLLVSGLFFLCNSIVAQTATDSLQNLLHNSCRAYEYMRNANGIYQKNVKFDGTANKNPSSVAVIGMGLTSLCISHAMGWEPNAKNLVLTTLQSMTGGSAGFNPPRNAAGFFPHYIDMDTGANVGSQGNPGTTSEYATIDNAVFISGVLFCKKYFNDPQVTALADQLWNTMDWTKVIADPTTGKVYLQLAEDGSCGINSNGICGTAKPFNEYILACWLAMNKEIDTTGPAHQLWNNFYDDPTNLPYSTYAGINVKVARPGDFIAEHVYQMPYFFCHAFSNDSRYLTIQDDARRTDIAWWNDQVVAHQDFEWGLSAGSTYTNALDGYSVDAVNANAKFIVSPHTLSGYLPVYPQGKYDLLKMWKNNLGVFGLPSDPVNHQVLWRYSKEPAHTNWKATYAQGVDFATFMLGLASLQEFLGTDFYNNNNDFFSIVPPNQPPVSNAGADQTITLPTSSVNLDGSASSDPDGSITTYAWAKVSGPPSSTIESPTAAQTVVNNLVNGAYKFELTVTDNGSLSSKDTVGIMVNDAPPPTYCATQGNNSSFEHIKTVQIGNINNNSGNNNGYRDYTSLTLNTSPGSNVSLSLTPGFASRPIREYWRVWIDYNKDGNFTDVGEKVFEGDSKKNISGSFSIPVTASHGQTGMRIAMKYDGYPTPCTPFAYGEVEDYTIDIKSGELTSSTSQNLEIMQAEIQSKSMIIYPQPTSQTVNVKLNASTDERVTVSLQNMQGETVKTSKYSLQKGINNISLNVHGSPSGIYVLRIDFKTYSTNSKIIIAR